MRHFFFFHFLKFLLVSFHSVRVQQRRYGVRHLLRQGFGSMPVQGMRIEQLLFHYYFLLFNNSLTHKHTQTNVQGVQCNTCKDGFTGLSSSLTQGCSDCGCNVGGSVNNTCDKTTGQVKMKDCVLFFCFWFGLLFYDTSVSKLITNSFSLCFFFPIFLVHMQNQCGGPQVRPVRGQHLLHRSKLHPWHPG